MKNKDIVESFNNAVNGVLHALKNEMSLKTHFVVAFLVLFASLWLDISRTELLILILIVTVVIVSELFNTAVEVIVNVMIKVYHPKAKIIKDVAAGAVLISTSSAIIIGYLIFIDKLNPQMKLAVDTIKHFPPYIILIALILTIITVLVIKTATKKGTPFRGGVPSGHSATAFAITTAIALWSGNMSITILCLILSFLVVQSRVEAKIHSIFEVTIGGVLGIMVTLMIFRLFWPSILG